MKGRRAFAPLGILAIVAIILAYNLTDNQETIWYVSISAVAYSIIASVITYFAGLFEDLITLKLYFKYFFSKGYWKSKSIRFSIAYLYQIKYNDKYLLVKNARFTSPTYQPVGGAYKRLPEANIELSKLEVTDDESIKIDKTSKDDLRVQVPKKYTFRFIDWFLKNENREYSHWREFQEELLETGILPKDKFPHIATKVKKRKFVDLEYSTHFGKWEIKIFDIIEPKFTPEQEEEIKKLYEKGNTEDAIWLKEIIIERAGNNPVTNEDEYKLGTQTKYIL